MCGRFALRENADDLEDHVRTHYAPNVAGWRDVPRHPASGTSFNRTDATGSQSDTSNNAHGYRACNFNVAPQTFVPVLYRPEDDQGTLASPTLQAMKWGLIPSYYKKRPDHALKTINARDDTVKSGGMWNTVRGKKRCVVFCDGFYEWQRKDKDRIPHYTKFPDGRMMAMAGLWDRTQFEGEDTPTYTFTIVTTDNNKQLAFLHDRMPVILPDKQSIAKWLDVSTGSFDKEVAALLVPYQGKLECYQVPKEVGKVGNNSEDFVKPISERKGNIASFFATTSSPAKSKKPAPVKKEETDVVSIDDVICIDDEDEAETPVASLGKRRSKPESQSHVTRPDPPDATNPRKKQKMSP